MDVLKFPPDFLWGVATAAAQIEGASQADGKGDSIWDVFSRQPGNIHSGDTPEPACDHYHLYGQDVQLMKSMGIRNYRFSISWPRILPQGSGVVNRAGVKFYKSLLEQLIQAGISPAVTLYHWDLPQTLQENGGWLNRETARHFADYCQVCFDQFGDLVPRWITLNEPQVVVMLGHEDGTHAPGIRRKDISLQVAHNLLLGHGLAVKRFRESGKSGEIGITLNMAQMTPASTKRSDISAADFFHTAGNDWYASAVLKGEYPQQIFEMFKKQGRAPKVDFGDMDVIGAKIDFVGINYYSNMVCKKDWLGRKQLARDEKLPKTAMGWSIYPQGLYDLLMRLSKDYPQTPWLITENGAAFDDSVDDNGEIQDSERIEFLRRHFVEAYKLIQQGVPLKGYFVWSFLDNFEWAEGYSKRFGIVYVQYSNQKRIIKKSGSFCSKVFSDNAVETSGHLS